MCWGHMGIMANRMKATTSGARRCARAPAASKACGGCTVASSTTAQGLFAGMEDTLPQTNMETHVVCI